tara:strand:+ start:131 stop:1222 length:1092 start_codon:yes stop_codon:yes gene_type:complete
MSIDDKQKKSAKEFWDLADSFHENKDYKSAIENYTKAIDINTNDPLLYLYRGQSKFKLKDYLGALSDYSKANELEPEDEYINESIGFVYSEMKDHKKAIQAFTTCIETNLCPSFSLYLHRAIQKRELNDYEGEIEDLTKAIKSLDEDDYILKTRLFKQRGKAREKLGDIKGSIDDFKKEKESSEKSTEEFFLNLIKEYKEYEACEYKDIDAYKEVFKNAQYLLENSINLSDKQRIELHIMKGNIQDDVRGNFDGAIKEYKKAIKIDSEDWTIWYNLGVCYGRKGETDLAISIYKKVIKLNPESGASYYNRAVQYLTKNEFDKACNDFHAAQRAGIDQACIAIEKYCEPKNLSAEELYLIEKKD